MGQYHHPVCIEAEEGLDPHGMDQGLKEGESAVPARPTRWSHSSAPAAAICRPTVRSRR